MNGVALIVAYVAVGVAAALWVLARQGRAGALSALTTLCLWPLWFPFATAQDRREDPEVGRILGVLAACRDAARGTPLASYIDDATLDAIRADVLRVAERRAAIERELGRVAPEAECAARLRAVRDRDARELEELVDVAQQLRAELVLARYGSGGDVRTLADELRARVEGLHGVGE
jgi:hypothetical protein